MNINEAKFLENYKKKIINECIKTLLKECNITDKYDNICDEIKLKKILLTEKTKRCIGCTNTTPIVQCSRKTVDKFNYCKIHLHKIAVKDNKIVYENLYVKQNKSENINKSNLTKKFIEDTFYYLDNVFIYNMNIEKVGYIQGKDYILTSDPFILELM
jgi:hypothetical protein